MKRKEMKRFDYNLEEVVKKEIKSEGWDYRLTKDGLVAAVKNGCKCVHIFDSKGKTLINDVGHDARQRSFYTTYFAHYTACKADSNFAIGMFKLMNVKPEGE